MLLFMECYLLMPREKKGERRVCIIIKQTVSAQYFTLTFNFQFRVLIRSIKETYFS